MVVMMMKMHALSCKSTSRASRQVPHCSAPARLSRSCLVRFNRRCLKVYAIGFAFEDREEDSIDVVRKKKLSTANTLASSLLIFQHVVKGAVGEAFLAAIASTSKYQAANKDIFAAYSKFFNLLVLAGYDDWQDYVLDQILLGRDNNFARAVAQGTVQPNAPILKAVAFDLDVLQQIAVPLHEIAEFVSEMAPTAGEYWMEAASSAALQPKSRQLSPPMDGPQAGLNLNIPQRFIQRPPTADELAQWKAAIANKESWSDAVSTLQQYYHLHGYGITSRNCTLRWTKGAFEEIPDREPLKPVQHLSALAERLSENTLRHVEGRGAHHVLVAGPSGVGKSTLVWETSLAIARERGLRLVDVGSSELSNILDIARGCGKYPRVRFLLVADNVDFPLRGSTAQDMLAGLSGAGAAGWPDNSLLYVVATASSTINSDALMARFGMFLPVPQMDMDGYAKAVKDLAEPQGLSSKLIDMGVMDTQEFTLRKASQYLKMLS